MQGGEGWDSVVNRLGALVVSGFGLQKVAKFMGLSLVRLVLSQRVSL